MIEPHFMVGAWNGEAPAVTAGKVLKHLPVIGLNNPECIAEVREITVEYDMSKPNGSAT